MTVVHSFDALVDALTNLGVAHRAVVEAREIELQVPGGLPGPLTIRWEKSVPFVSVYQHVLDDLPAARMGELETAVTRVNHHLEVPGFGLDHDQRRLYFRSSAPAFAGVEVDTLNRLARGVLANAKEFAASFAAIVSGRAGLEIAEIYKGYAQSREARFFTEGA
jgi:hypothetical protein